MKDSKFKKYIPLFISIFLSFTLMLSIYSLGEMAKSDGISLDNIPFLDLAIVIFCSHFLKIYIPQVRALIKDLDFISRFKNRNK